MLESPWKDVVANFTVPLREVLTIPYGSYLTYGIIEVLQVNQSIAYLIVTSRNF